MDYSFLIIQVQIFQTPNCSFAQRKLELRAHFSAPGKTWQFICYTTLKLQSHQSTSSVLWSFSVITKPIQNFPKGQDQHLKKSLTLHETKSMPYYPASETPPPNLILSSAVISDPYQVSVWTQLGSVISSLPPWACVTLVWIFYSFTDRSIKRFL